MKVLGLSIGFTEANRHRMPKCCQVEAAGSKHKARCVVLPFLAHIRLGCWRETVRLDSIRQLWPGMDDQGFLKGAS